MTNTRSSGMSNVGSIFAELEKRTGAMGVDMSEVRKKAEETAALRDRLESPPAPAAEIARTAGHPFSAPKDLASWGCTVCGGDESAHAQAAPAVDQVGAAIEDPVSVSDLAGRIEKVVEAWAYDVRAHASGCSGCDCGVAEVRREEAMRLLERRS